MNSELGAAWLQQIAWCDKAGSPFTARVLEAAWNDWLAGGTLRELMPDWPGDPWADAPPLRVAGALHSLALESAEPALEAIYPPRAIAFDPVTGAQAVRNALRVHRERVAEYLRRPPQTNEIGRSAVLLGGFATIAARTGLPLALREIGASAGLNLLWHRYRYELGGSLVWGDPVSPVTVRSKWKEHPPMLPSRIDLASWHGCDKTPIDLGAPHAAARLAAYIWPDHRERVERLQAAIALARSEGVSVEQADAATFLTRELAATRSGEATVVYHSIVLQYLSEQTRSALDRVIAEAGARATLGAPLAWLALEPPDPKSRPLLVLTLWPGGDRTVLAEALPHGQSVRWYAQTTQAG